ncbi:hypothetical protein A2Y99_02935 [Candidatus Gottesmanbacteria bacterium RBG_13_37_7]|uniref:ABC transporter permease n=1 Tax=Candidatus Gottesmanbacteria bacterium RBG_13_37_7 TaxID=1798369 RepID=A0A1F5YIQ6_9BACT|nr:MAG: hypothetical protein A2Y99_02935 [Candidatus Gottesmanbacteria bacterium RBG_13_37_7]
MDNLIGIFGKKNLEKRFKNIHGRGIMKKYFHIWIYLTAASFQSFFVSRIGAVLFLSGKIFRFVFFLGFLILLVSRTKILAGYNLNQILIFYLTFNFIDSITQMLFREVYRFRSQVISGDFDLILLKPVNALFRVLFGGTDFLDFVTLLPLIIIIAYLIFQIPNISLLGIIIYIILIINALVISSAFHIIVLALAIFTVEIDNTIMIYRDVMSMGKLPIDVYREPIRSFITFAIPVGIMLTYPPRALFNLLHVHYLMIAFIFGSGFLLFSLLFWRFALKHYTSASS